MKNKIILLAVIAFAIFIAGCTYDNYDAPTSSLSGTVVFNGNPVGVRSNATELELWEYHWDTRGVVARAKIPVYIAQDGTFSTRLFDGDYKLVRLSGAPWAAQTDSIDVTVKGKTIVDVPVTPYFIISNPTFTNNAGVITATCNVSKIGTNNIGSLTLYAGVTTLTDQNNSSQTASIASSGLTDLTTTKTITLTLNAANAARAYIYVRLGIQTSGVAERFYTPVQKIVLH